MPPIYNKALGRYVDAPLVSEVLSRPGFADGCAAVRKAEADVVRPVCDSGGRGIKTNPPMQEWENGIMRDPGTLHARREESRWQLSHKSADDTYMSDYRQGKGYERAVKPDYVCDSRLGQHDVSRQLHSAKQRGVRHAEKLSRATPEEIEADRVGHEEYLALRAECAIVNARSSGLTGGSK